MPSKRHVPPTGELTYKSVGRKDRFKLVPVASRATTSKAPPPTAPPPPSIEPPTAEPFDDQNEDSLFTNSESLPKRTGKVSRGSSVWICQGFIHISFTYIETNRLHEAMA